MFPDEKTRVEQKLCLRLLCRYFGWQSYIIMDPLLVHHPFWGFGIWQQILPCCLLSAALLAMASVTVWYQRSRRPAPQPEISEEEKDQLIEDWTPEPLTPPLDPYHHALRPRQVTSIYGKRITVDKVACLNFATHNYLGFVEDQECLNAATSALETYGVGSCGPRGFFGTVDVHLQLEEKIAAFMGAEEAILYSFGFSAISSSIPAYAKVGDVIYADEGVNFAVQQGLKASRSTIHYFKHNDVEDLARLINEQALDDEKNPKLAKTRCSFIVVEGLYINYGDICPLPEIVNLKHKHKMRLFIDDSCAFGVLGASGRGVVEHYDLDVSMDVDMIAASLEYGIAAYGGFCTGSYYIIDHQRLSGLGYCFSASLPPLQAAVALKSIDLIRREPERVLLVRERSTVMHSLLAASSRSKYLTVYGSAVSPIKHLRFAVPIEQAMKSRQEPSARLKRANKSFYSFKERTCSELDTYRLEAVVNYAQKNGLALTVSRYLEEEEHRTPEPSIRLTVCTSFTESELEEAADLIVEAFQEVHQQFQAGHI